MPASMAAPTSATCTWTFHSRPVGVSTPTMTRLSPSAARRSCRRATARSSVSASRNWTSLPGPAGGWCGRCSPEWLVAVPWSRRASGGRAGSTPVTVVDQGVEDQAEAGAAGVDHSGVAQDRELARRRLEGGAGTVGGRADDVGEVGASLVDGGDRGFGAGAGDREECPFLGVGDGGVGGVGGLLEGGGEGRAVGRAAGRRDGRRGRAGAGRGSCRSCRGHRGRRRGRGPTRRTRWCAGPRGRARRRRPGR